MDELARQVCQQVAAEVVNTTPVDTGFLRGSWQPSIGKPASGPGNGADASAVGLVAQEVKAGDVFFMTNNAAYARRIEFGFAGTDAAGRTYDQAGRFFVRRAIKRGKLFAQRLVSQMVQQ